jgi:hypothetical protein
MSVRPHRRTAGSAVAAATVLTWAGSALAQEDPGTVPVETSSGTVVQVTPGSTTTTHTYVPPPGFPQPGTDINAGLPSSSRPTSGGGRDSFDLGSGSGGSVLRGDKGAPGIVTTGRARVMVVPEIHLVTHGDTLWDLCARYFDNPWSWPKVWSNNPQVQNPHWIYPGDQIRLRMGGGGGGTGDDGLGGKRLAPGQSRSLGGGGGGGDGGMGRLLSERSRVPPQTVFLRDQGYVGDPDRDVWGELVGALEDQMLLSDGNHVYLQMKPGKDVKVGQRLTIFQTVRQPKPVKGARKPKGEIVAIRGSVRIENWDPETRVARAEITESVDAIERGAKIGPVGRRFDVVAPRAAGVTLWTYVLTSLYPHVYMGQNQVVFLDRGSDDGLRAGNRLLVVRKGDTWRRSLKTASSTARSRVRIDSPAAVDVETTPLQGDENKFPAEVIAELRVLRAEKQSSVALVVESAREIVAGDRALARKGY